MSIWPIRYCGLKWKPDFNCWDLVKRIYAEQLLLNIKTEFDDVQNPLDVVETQQVFLNIADRWNLIDNPKEFDICAMGKRDVIHHVGIVINKDYIFHLTPFKLACSDSIRQIQKDYKTIRFYRHAHCL